MKVAIHPHVKWQDLTRLGPFRWNNLAPLRAVRVAFGVVVPLVLGLIGGHTEYGAYAALGALPAGFASFQGEARTRVGAVVVACIGMAVSAFVGATAAEYAPWSLVLVVAVWGYVTGLAVSFGSWISVAVLQWSVALLIAVGMPMAPSEAALRAGLVLAGGLFQALLVAVLWLLRPGSQERVALAASYRALAQYAARLAAGIAEAPPPVAFPAHTAIDDPNPLLPWAVRLTFVNLLEQAERIRASLAALSTHVAGSGQPQLSELMADAVRALGLIADALDADRRRRLVALRALRRLLSQRSVPPDAAWRWAGEALLGQLRAVGRIMARLEVPHLAETHAGKVAFAPREQSAVAMALTTLRANVGKSTEAGRHALRLAVIAMLAEAIVQAVGLFQGRWVILTIFIVLKPDYASTIYRGVQRAVGTMLGAGIGALIALTNPGQVGLITAAGLCIAVAYALFDVGYVLFSIALTAFILALLDLMGSPGLATAEARLLDTFIGSVLATAAYFAWPTWEGVAAPEKFAQLIEAHREYATALLREVGHPGSVGSAELRLRQTAARRARSEAEAATQRLSDEPVHPPLTPPVAQVLIAAVARLAHAELALHALLLSAGRTTSTQDASGAFAHIDVLNNAIDAAMDYLALALRTLTPPQAIPALRRIQLAQFGCSNDRNNPVLGITDQIVDAIDAVDNIVRKQLSQPTD